MTDTLAAILALVPVPDMAKATLRARLAEPSRHYHGTAHVALLWARHRQYGAGLSVHHEPWNTWIACAIAYHDAIYNAARGDNEAASAALWQSAEPALPADGIAWVTGTILATANHRAAAPEPGMTEPAWAARAWMLDLDLTPLGETPDAFDANTVALRREYAHLSNVAWTTGRNSFLRSIAETPRLFRTPALHTAFDAQARDNIVRELRAQVGNQ